MKESRLALWVEEAGRRRRLDRIGEPFHPGIVDETAPGRDRAWRGAAAALVALVARRAVSVTFTPGVSFADTKGGRVNLDPTVFETSASFADALEVLFALAAHEGAHGRYTRAVSRKAGRLFHWIHNLVEDERIESLLAETHPILIHPLDRARRQLMRVEKHDGGALAALFVLVRAPERMPPALWAAHEAMLLGAIDELTPFPRSTRELTKAVRRLFDLLPRSLREAELPFAIGCGCDGDFGGDEVRGTGLGSEAGGRSRGGGRVDRHPRVRWRQAKPDAAGYEKMRGHVQQDARAFAAALRGLLPPRTVHRKREGRLDRRRLPWATLDDRLFDQPGGVDERMVLAILIDLSGSMRGRSERIAQRLAVTMVEGAQMLRGVRLYVYGHTADSEEGPSTEIVRFGTPARGRVYGLGRLPIGHNNRDAHAIEAVGRDLLKHEAARHVPRMGMVICDGLPEAKGFRGDAAVEATRRSLAWFGQVWGPSILVATRETPQLARLKPGPQFSYGGTNPMPTLVRVMARELRAARA